MVGTAGSSGGVGGYFTSDRAIKYGYGVPRLLLLTLFAFEVAPRLFLKNADGGASSAFMRSSSSAAALLRLSPYLTSMRWAGHSYLGSIGAGVNVQVWGFLGNLAMLLVAAAACMWDVTHGKGQAFIPSSLHKNAL
jgi:hypothetical protein